MIIRRLIPTGHGERTDYNQWHTSTGVKGPPTRIVRLDDLIVSKDKYASNSRASTPAFAMSCSSGDFSTVCAKSSRVADATTTRSGSTAQSDTSHQHQRCSCPATLAAPPTLADLLLWSARTQPPSSARDDALARCCRGPSAHQLNHLFDNEAASMMAYFERGALALLTRRGLGGMARCPTYATEQRVAGITRRG